jgi:hypothetical protein
LGKGLMWVKVATVRTVSVTGRHERNGSPRVKSRRGAELNAQPALHLNLGTRTRRRKSTSFLLQIERTVFPAPFRPTIRVKGLGNTMAWSLSGEKLRMP